MAKFTKGELKKSLIDNLTLVKREDNFKWCEFHELSDFLKDGYIIFNDEKREYYERMIK